MSETRDFPTAAVLSAITGVMIVETVEPIYEVLRFMCDGPVWTHQLSRIGREAEKVMVARQPLLAEAIAEARQVNRDNWRTWRASWERLYGPTIAVPRFGEREHDTKDPVSELRDMGVEPIIVVAP